MQQQQFNLNRNGPPLTLFFKKEIRFFLSGIRDHFYVRCPVKIIVWTQMLEMLELLKPLQSSHLIEPPDVWSIWKSGLKLNFFLNDWTSGGI